MKTNLSHVLGGPHTVAGKWSIGLIVAMPILFVIGSLSMNLFYPSVPAGTTIMGDLAARPALALSMLTGIACGICACLTGWAALLRQKERSLFVFLSTAVGGLLLIFLLGEFISPD